jgi:hypothetical protein
MLTQADAVFWSSNARTTEHSCVTIALPRPTILTSLTIVVPEKCQPDTLTLSVCPAGSAEYVDLGAVGSASLMRSLRVPLSHNSATTVSSLRLTFNGFAEVNKERMHGITFIQLREKAKVALHCPSPALLLSLQQFLLSIGTSSRAPAIKDSVWAPASVPCPAPLPLFDCFCTVLPLCRCLWLLACLSDHVPVAAFLPVWQRARCVR